MKQRLLRKVECLEGLISPAQISGPHDAMVSAVLTRVATNDLLLLIEAFEMGLPYAQWNAAQVSAGESLRLAWEGECSQAGFKSVADFERLYPAPANATLPGRTGPLPWKHRIRHR